MKNTTKHDENLSSFILFFKNKYLYTYTYIHKKDEDVFY